MSSLNQNKHFYTTKSFRLISVAFFIFCLFALGYFRSHIFLGIQNLFGLSVNSAVTKYPSGWQALWESVWARPEWIVSLVYNQFFGIVSALIILSWFHNKQYAKTTWYVYFLLEVLCVLLLIFLGLLEAPTVKHYLVVRLRNFIQSPLFAIVMYMYFRRLDRIEQ